MKNILQMILYNCVFSFSFLVLTKPWNGLISSDLPKAIHFNSSAWHLKYSKILPPYFTINSTGPFTYADSSNWPMLISASKMTNLYSLKIYEVLIPSALFRDRTFKKVINIKWGHTGML